jgi:integrase/recombinase XerC/integrase/recombinase XerD
MSLYHLTTASPYDAARSDLRRLTTAADSLADQFNSFLLNAQIELSPATVRDYRYKLKPFIDYCRGAGASKVMDITTDNTRGFIASMQESNSPKSVNDYYKVARRFLSWLVQEERLTKNPMLRVKCPRVPEIIIKIFTAEHIHKILLLCEDGTRTGIRNRAMVLVLLDSGIRLSELARIQVDDIDIQRGIITVMGKGAKQRVVGVSKPTLKAVIRYYEARPGDHSQLWLTEEGKPITPAGISQIFKALKRRAGFSDVRLSAHTFRHTSGTMALLNGASEREVQLLLGHSTPRMTQHYTATITSQMVVERHKDFSPVSKLNLK